MKRLPVNLIAALVLVASLGLLLSRVSGEPANGLSAYILVQKLGLDPLPQFSGPVYGLFVKTLAAVAGRHAVFAINAFSAVCGAGALLALFSLMYRLTRTYIGDKVFSAAVSHRIQLGSALVSVLYLFAAEPFVLAATRAGPLTFDLLLLLSSFLLAVSVTAQHRLSRVCLATLLYGVTVVEFNTAIIAGPLFGILILFKLWRIQALNFRGIATAFLAGLSGLVLYLIQAGLFMATPAYEWREFAGYFEVLWYIWQEQYILLVAILPRVGWLTLGLVSIVPWGITSFMRLSRGPIRTRGAVFGIVTLHILLGALAVLLLVDGFPLAPVTLTGTERLFVSPYVIIALWVGQVFAFWLIFLLRDRRFESAAFRVGRRALAVAIIIATPLYLLYGIAFGFLSSTRSPDDAVVRRFVSGVVDASEGREWLITNTPFDDQITLEAYRRGLPLRFLRLSHGRSIPYMRYIASQFRDQPRLESLSRIGLAPLLDEWFVRMPDIEQRVAVVHLPDMFLSAGYEALPDRAVFTGVKADAALDLDAVLARNRAFWADMESIPSAENRGPLSQWVWTHLSKLANNLGVALEDHGRDDDAYACYRQARVFDPDNLSALMNMHVMAGRRELPDYQQLEDELKQRTAAVMGRVQPWTLSYVYGYVRVPELFVNRGMAFAMSGKANMAIADMKRALTLRESDPAAQLALAGLYFDQGMDVESREYFRGVLAVNPREKGALLGLMRIAARQGDIDEARGYLDRLRELNVNDLALKQEEAVIEMFDGSPEKALALFRQVLEKNADNKRAWAAIAIIAGQMKDASLLEEAVGHLGDSELMSPDIQMAMAQSSLDQNDRDAALRHLTDILRKQPGHIRALEMVLRIHLAQGNSDLVQTTVEEILAYQPANPLANYLLGVHHYLNEEYQLAESAFRASLAAKKTAEALNDLAYILYLQNQIAEAESLVRESIAMNPGVSTSWDTLGVILMKQGALEEAEKAMVRSLAIQPESASTTLSLAILNENKGRFEEADRLAREVSARINDLPPSDQAALSQLRLRLDERRP